MAALLAHARLLGRHHRTAVVGGYHWRYCHHHSHHHSHRLRLRCWRWFVYDGYCARHNDSCWGDCPTGLEP